MLDAAVMARFDALRRAWYPAERNRVPAHVSLFHQLPGSELDAVRRRLKAVCAGVPPPVVTVAGPKRLGQGVAFRLRSPGLAEVHGELAAGWGTLLVAQDRAGFDPHVTIQNKVDDATARATLQALAASFAPFDCHARAVAIWRYCDGPWEPLGEVAFRGRA